MSFDLQTKRAWHVKDGYCCLEWDNDINVLSYKDVKFPTFAFPVVLHWSRIVSVVRRTSCLPNCCSIHPVGFAIVCSPSQWNTLWVNGDYGPWTQLNSHSTSHSLLPEWNLCCLLMLLCPLATYTGHMLKFLTSCSRMFSSLTSRSAWLRCWIFVSSCKDRNKMNEHCVQQARAWHSTFYWKLLLFYKYSCFLRCWEM
jgi:hypothetical protein